MAREVELGERMSDREVVEQMNDLEMMRRPHLWPQVFLPLKRASKRNKRPYMQTAVLNKIAKGKFEVAYDKTIFESLKSADFVPIDPEALIAEGWVVD